MSTSPRGSLAEPVNTRAHHPTAGVTVTRTNSSPSAARLLRIRPNIEFVVSVAVDQAVLLGQHALDIAVIRRILPGELGDPRPVAALVHNDDVAFFPATESESKIVDQMIVEAEREGPLRAGDDRRAVCGVRLEKPRRLEIAVPIRILPDARTCDRKLNDRDRDQHGARGPLLEVTRD